MEIGSFVGVKMTSEELFKLQVWLNAVINEREAMVAANQISQYTGGRPIYDQLHFLALNDKLGNIRDALS